MIIEVTGGLTPRLDVLASIISTKYFPDHIKLVWKKIPGLMANFHELFTNNIEFIDVDKLEYSNYIYSPGSTINPEQHINSYLTASWPVYFPDTSHTPFSPTNHTHSFNQFFKELKPVKAIRDLIVYYKQKFPEKIYGINIRRGTGINYHFNSTIFSPISLFLNKIQELHSNNNRRRDQDQARHGRQVQSREKTKGCGLIPPYKLARQ